MANSTCIKPIKGKVIRLVRLDTCGNAVTGSTGQLVTDGFVMVTFSPQYEEGEEFVQRNANGDLCINEKDSDRLKRFDITIQLCEVDPAAIELMTGNALVMDGVTAIGNSYDETPNTTKFALEIWNDLAGGACAEGGQQWNHWTLAWVENGKLGDITHEYGPQTWEITANTHANPNYGAGPFDLWLGNELGARTHAKSQVTSVAPPDTECGYQTLAA